MKVPAGKTIYVKRLRFCEGQELPSGVNFGPLPIMTKQEAETVKEPEREKRPYHRRNFGDE
jgi:hypothetical protein